MKKLFSLGLVVVMLLTLASYAAAGTITWGGNLRFWYMDVQSPTQGESTFQFDRVALIFKDVLSDHDGISAEVQWRNYSSNDGTITSKTTWTDSNGDGKIDDGELSTTSNSGGSKQARLDSGYYYYDGLFAKGDEITIGALSSLPFKNGVSKNVNFVDGGLGSRLKVGYAPGIAYVYNNPRFTIAGGIENGNGKDITNYADKCEGFAYSVRLDTGKNFFGVVPGLMVGVATNKMYNTVDSSAGNGMEHNYLQTKLADIAYVNSIFWVNAEYGSQTKDLSGVEKDGKAYYFETGVNIGKAKLWVGRLINDSDSEYYLYQYKDTLTGVNVINKNFLNGDILAAIVPILTNDALQFQYIRGDGGDYKEMDLRLMVTF